MVRENCFSLFTESFGLTCLWPLSTNHVLGLYARKNGHKKYFIKLLKDSTKYESEIVLTANCFLRNRTGAEAEMNL